VIAALSDSLRSYAPAPRLPHASPMSADALRQPRSFDLNGGATLHLFCFNMLLVVARKPHKRTILIHQHLASSHVSRRERIISRLEFASICFCDACRGDTRAASKHNLTRHRMKRPYAHACVCVIRVTQLSTPLCALDSRIVETGRHQMIVRLIPPCESELSIDR
jgi:hypothetical protein